MRTLLSQVAKYLMAYGNLLGQHASQIASLQAQDDVSTHLYGKSTYHDGRKIGHITYAISADRLSDNDDKSYKVD